MSLAEKLGHKLGVGKDGNRWKDKNPAFSG